MRKLAFAVVGIIAGFFNGFFGSGGGLVAIPCLKKIGLKQKESHINSIALTLSLSFFSAIFYFLNGNIDFKSALIFIPTGLLGAFFGAKFFKQINAKTLGIIFAFILIISGVRLFLK